MKKCLTNVQVKNVKAFDYKDSARVHFDTTLAQTWELSYGTPALKMTVEEDTTLDPQATDRLEWWLKYTDKIERDRLLKKAYDFNMVLIYLYGCNINEMRTDFAKA